MNARQAVLAALAVLPALASRAVSQQAPTFEQLLSAGFRQVSAAVPETAAPAVPASASAETRVPGDDRGAYLFSSGDGSVFFCSVAGCRRVLDRAASTVVRAGDGLYFTGPQGTGYCAPRRCDVLAHVQLQLTLGAGPAGDVYGVEKSGVWRCAPTSCAREFSGSVRADGNYFSGVYKANGDFVGDAPDGTFWCSQGSCRRVRGADMIVIEDNCGGTAPLGVSYGIWGHQIFRCTPEGCRTAASADDDVDNYVSCAFDAEGRLHVPARGPGSVVCGETCRTDRADATAYPETPKYVRSAYDERRQLGTDGAVYSIASFDKAPAPAPNGAQQLPPTITRADAKGSSTLSFDSLANCASWWTSAPGDEDEDGGDHWEPQCRLIP